jgi:hypothetical protein
MEAAGLMSDAGRRSVEVARRNGFWTIYDPVEDLIEPDDAWFGDEPARRVWIGDSKVGHRQRRATSRNIAPSSFSKSRRLASPVETRSMKPHSHTMCGSSAH